MKSADELKGILAELAMEKLDPLHISWENWRKLSKTQRNPSRARSALRRSIGSQKQVEFMCTPWAKLTSHYRAE
jgi:hypothetical protein